MHEIAYSQLLVHLVQLFDKIIISSGGSRRDCEAFLRNMAPIMHNFNPIEVQDYFVEKLDALITFSCDLVRGAAFNFLSHLISLQYRKELRMSLVQKLKEYVYTGSTIQQRKNFITFCSESVKVNTPERDGFFDKYFFPHLLKLGYNDINYSVQMHLVRHLAGIRDSVIKNGDKLAYQQLEQLIVELQGKRSLHKEVRSSLDSVCTQFNTDVDKARISALASIDIEARR